MKRTISWLMSCALVTAPFGSSWANSNIVVTTEMVSRVAAAPSVERGGSLAFSFSFSEGDAESLNPSVGIDAQGVRRVSFESLSTNFGPYNGATQIFRSPNGFFNPIQVLSFAAQGLGSAASREPEVSADGRFTVYSSGSTNLVFPLNNPGLYNIFINDGGNPPDVISRSSAGVYGDGNSEKPWISHNGEYIVFASNSTNLDPVHTTGEYAVYVHRRTTGETHFVAKAGAGFFNQGGRATVSNDGRWVAYVDAPGASPLLPTYLYLVDRALPQGSSPYLISQDGAGNPINGYFFTPRFSANGRHLTFQSNAVGIVPGDLVNYDVFHWDRLTGVFDKISRSAPVGSIPNESSYFPTISPDGRFIVYESYASNLVLGDSNNTMDVFLFDRLSKQTIRMSVTAPGSQANGYSSAADIALNEDELCVTYQSEANNLSSNDINNTWDAFLSCVDMNDFPSPAFTATRVTTPQGGIAGF